MSKITEKVFYECGCCGHYHPASFTGDCREDENRYRWDELPEGWVEVSQDDFSYIKA